MLMEQTHSDLAAVLQRARLCAAVADDPAVAKRLHRSVIRPLEAVVGDTADAIAPPDAENVWQLALDATRLRSAPDAPPELTEVTAALQRLGVAVDDEQARTARLDELRQLQAELPTGIHSADNGPY